MNHIRLFVSTAASENGHDPHINITDELAAEIVKRGAEKLLAGRMLTPNADPDGPANVVALLDHCEPLAPGEPFTIGGPDRGQPSGDDPMTAIISMINILEINRSIASEIAAQGRQAVADMRARLAVVKHRDRITAQPSGDDAAWSDLVTACRSTEDAGGGMLMVSGPARRAVIAKESEVAALRARLAEAERTSAEWERAADDYLDMKDRLARAEAGLAAVDHVRLHALNSENRSLAAQVEALKADLAVERERREADSKVHSECANKWIQVEKDLAAANERAHQVTLQWEEMRLAKEAAGMAARDANERAEAEMQHANKWSRKAHAARSEADAAKADAKAANEEGAKFAAQAAAAVLEVARLKERKVKLPKGFTSDPAGAAAVIDAIRAAGIEVLA